MRSACRRRCRRSIPVVSVPYGALVPAELDGLLVAGRAVSCDATSHSFLREVPQCWMTGQAAGVAAALAAGAGVVPAGGADPAGAGDAGAARRAGAGAGRGRGVDS